MISLKIISFILIFCAKSTSFAYFYDIPLSRKITLEYIVRITQTETGDKFYKNYRSVKKNLPSVFFRYSDDKGLAWYERDLDRIYFNTKYVMLFFDIKDYTDERIIDVLFFSTATRREFVKYSDVVYLHELVHSLSDFKYAGAKYWKEGLFVELEYEAYLVSDMYFFDKAKKEKEWFMKLLKGEYFDPYTWEYYMAFLTLSMDINEYKENIELRYRNELNAYVSLNDELTKKRYKLEEKKIGYYMTGKKGNLEEEEKDFKKFEEEKKKYSALLNEYYTKIWPDFSYRALRFLIDSSFEVRNYYVFFNAVYYFEKNKDYYGFKTDKDLEEKKAICYLEFDSFVKNYTQSKKIDYEFISLNIMAFERFCEITKRAFPESLARLKEDSYRDTLKKYERMIKTEDDLLKKHYYREFIDYFKKKLKLNNYELSPLTPLM